MTQIVRLYVSPLTQETFISICPTALTSSSPSTSFHTLTTCPESSFGYIELPAMEAEKLKKKLNGSILKGKKMRVEKARPLKRGYVPDAEPDVPESSPQVPTQRSTRSKRARSQLEGHELSPDREIKRGWTKPGKEARAKSPSGKTPSKSKYTDKKECLFRTQLPPNKESNDLVTEPDAKEREKKRSKKAKKGETIVHEFEKSTTQPAFIKPKARNSKIGLSAEYIDGKGWVDQDGNLVEKAPQEAPRRTSARGAPQASPTASTSSSGEDSDIENETSEPNPGKPKASSSNSSLTDAHQNKLLPPPIPIIKTTEVDAADRTEVAIETDEASQTGPHPLETLFKRPTRAASQTSNKRSLEIKTTFNFFEPDQPEKPGGVPQTPFTTRDLHQRGLRSAAPTPDTALPTRRFFPESSSPESDAASDEAKSTSRQDGKPPADPEGSKGEKGESEFSQWFWENRGDNNRAWKKRRREAKKETRQQENRQTKS